MRGPVEEGFLAAVARFAGPVRGVGVVLLSAFGVLSVPGDGVLLALAVLGVVLLGAVADFAGPRVAFVPALVRVVAVCAVQGWVGGSGQWALNVLTTSAVTLQWEWSPRVTVPVTAALLVAHGSLVGWDGTAVLRVVVECALARAAFALLRRSTRRVDEVRARRAAATRAEAVAVERRRREREYLALLHDTASATFLVVAVGGAEPAAVAGYARRDLDLLTGGGGVPRESVVDVGAAVRAVVERSPLRVETSLDKVLVPPSVALALVRAVREALLNVERHAGADDASVAVVALADGVVVTVRDAGRGFDVGAVSEHRRGIRGSVVERVAAVGGRAEVVSGPGGTVVRMTWSRG
ncbi:sensor histidine kinase [Saccharothrix sp. Mg75]|uniref:sensor histidine kinase n=1 Tax=Saccharothrix sp. Mg75 TaxID=3445357 RepID=UPI003EF03ABF